MSEAGEIVKDWVAWGILSLDKFCADDLHGRGTKAIDAWRLPNGAQSTIGAIINWASQQGYIEWRGETVNSQTATRKQGTQRVWYPTEAGVRWARARLRNRQLPDQQELPLEQPEPEPVPTAPTLRNFD